MDFDDSPDEAEYRSRVRELLEQHAGDLLQLAPGQEGIDARTHEVEMRRTQRVLYDAGLVGVTWPSGSSASRCPSRPGVPGGPCSTSRW